MTAKPAYIVHEVEERDVTVDWLFGRGRWATKAGQSALIVIAWFFAILPIVITASALIHRDDPDRGWWGYQEGFDMWDTTIRLLAVIASLWVVGFAVLMLVNRRQTRERDRTTTYDAERLDQRLDVVEHWYADKYGPEALRLDERTIRIEPYGGIGTYELRNLYRSYGVDR